MTKRDKTYGKQTLVGWQTNIEPEKDVAYINKMAAVGWKATEIQGGCRFIFIPCEPGEYTCQTAFTMKRSGFLDRKRYRELAELLTQSGAEVISQRISLGSRFGIYAMRKTSLGPFEINTDIDSRIQEFKQRRNYHLKFAVLFLVILILSIVPVMQTWEPPVNWIYTLACFIFLVALSSVAYRYDRVMRHLKAERDIIEG